MVNGTIVICKISVKDISEQVTGVVNLFICPSVFNQYGFTGCAGFTVNNKSSKSIKITKIEIVDNTGKVHLKSDLSDIVAGNSTKKYQFEIYRVQEPVIRAYYIVDGKQYTVDDEVNMDNL